jgi:hypothetical protein
MRIKAMIGACAVAGALFVASEGQASAANYTLYFHGRGWSSWDGAALANVPNWTNVTFSYDGSDRLDGPATTTVTNGIRSYCGAGNSCVIECYSAGCLRTFKAISDLRGGGNGLPGLLWVQAVGSAAGGSKLAEITTGGLTSVLAKLLGQQERIDFDITPSSARKVWGYVQDDAGVPVYHLAGRGNLCITLAGVVSICGNRFLAEGSGDGAVSFHSAGGGSDRGSYTDLCTMPKYPYRQHEPSAPCTGDLGNHSQLHGKGALAVGNRLGGAGADPQRNWSDAAQTACSGAQCDGAFTVASRDWSRTPAGVSFATSTDPTSSNTVASTAGATCAGKCGGFSGAGCWCDAACVDKGDCCADYAGAANCGVVNGSGTFDSVLSYQYIYKNGSDQKGQGTFDSDNNRTLRFADVDGDRKADACIRMDYGVVCHRSTGVGWAYSAAFDTTIMGRSEVSFGDSVVDTFGFADLNGDLKDDVCVRRTNGMLCYLSTGAGFQAVAGLNTAHFANASDIDTNDNYKTLAYPDVNGDGRADVCIRRDTGVQCILSTGTGFSAPASWKTTLFANGGAGFDGDNNYLTVKFADVNGDGRADVCGRTDNGLRCFLSDGNTFVSHAGYVTTFYASNNDASEYRTLSFPDLDGDRKADVCLRRKAGFLCYRSTGSGFVSVAGYDTALAKDGSDQKGYGTFDDNNWSSIRFGDIDGDAKDDLCVRMDYGTHCWISTGTGFAYNATYDSSANGRWLFSNKWPQYGFGSLDWDNFDTFHLVDFNADGKADFAMRMDYGIAGYTN